jgi:hypothetical protein
MLAKPLELIDIFGAGGRNRTDTTRGSGDFESPASTNFTTPARVRLYGTGARRVKDIWSGPVRQSRRRRFRSPFGGHADFFW